VGSFLVNHQAKHIWPACFTCQISYQKCSTTTALLDKNHLIKSQQHISFSVCIMRIMQYTLDHNSFPQLQENSYLPTTNVPSRAMQNLQVQVIIPTQVLIYLTLFNSTRGKTLLLFHTYFTVRSHVQNAITLTN